MRQLVAISAVYADLGGDGGSGVRVVAAEHHGIDAQLVQLGDGFAAAFFHRVGHGKQRQHLHLIGQQHHGFALALERF